MFQMMAVHQGFMTSRVYPVATSVLSMLGARTSAVKERRKNTASARIALSWACPR